MSLRGFDKSDSEYWLKMPGSQISWFLEHIPIMSLIAFQSHNGVSVPDTGDSFGAERRSAPRVYGMSIALARAPRIRLYA
jgi:hypothetical protein